MPNTDTTFLSNTAYLMKGIDKEISGVIKYQEEDMNSGTFNDGMAFIQKELDELYVRTRVLQDVVAYTKSFLKKEISESRDDMYELLKIIELSRDSLKDKGYMSKTVQFSDAWNRELRDRDGSTLERCSVSKGTLGLSGQELEQVKINELSMKQEVTAYASNLNDLKDGKEYRSFYILDGPATNGVNEEITVMFDEPKYINHINIENVNCDIKSVYVINESGVPEQMIGEISSGTKLKKAIGLKFIITDQDYQQVTYEIDATRMRSDFWQKVSSREHAVANKQSYTFDLEQETGIAQYKKDHANYLTKMAEWTAAKNAIDTANAAKRAQYDSEYAAWSQQYGSL